MSRRAGRTGGWFVLALVCAALAILPFYWALSLSLRHPGDALTVSGPAIPFLQYEPTLANWRTELRTGETQAALGNSLWISAGAVLLTLALGTPAAYALARFRFQHPRNQDLMIWFLSQRVLPPVATVIPFFFLFAHLNLLDTRWALILINTTFCLPFVVVIMRQAFIDLPHELTEAAMVDGAGHGRIFLRIALPLAAPSVAATVLIVTAFSWNEFMFALQIGQSHAKVIPVHMAGAVGVRGIEFWFIAVRSLIAILPPVLLALLAQRYIVRGLTFGAVKA